MQAAPVTADIIYLDDHRPPLPGAAEGEATLDELFKPIGASPTPDAATIDVFSGIAEFLRGVVPAEALAAMAAGELTANDAIYADGGDELSILDPPPVA